MPQSPVPGAQERRAGNGGLDGGDYLERLIVRSAGRILLLVLAFLVIALLAWRLRVLLLLIVVSCFVAVLVNPLVKLVMKKVRHRATASVLVYLGLVIVGVAIGYLLFHPVYKSALHFSRDLPHLVRQAQHGNGWIGHLVRRFHLANYIATHSPQLQSAITHFSKPALAFGKSVVSGVVSIVTIGFMSFFLVLEGPKVFSAMLDLVSPRRERLVRRTAEAVTSQVTGFMLGDFATSVIAGVVIYITLQIMGVPFAGVLSIWVGLVDFLPLIGGLLAGVPTIGLAFVHSVPAGIVTVIVFLVYQQIENHILYPIVVSRTVSLNPLLVLLAVLIGAEIGGIIGSTFGAIAGAILAVPAAGSLQIAVGEYLKERRETTEEAA